MLGVASQVKSQPILESSQVTTQCKSCQVTSIWLQVKSHMFTACHVLKLFVHGFLRGNFIILFGLNIFFKGLNWFHYILSKASDLHCQQVIFSKSQVKSQVMDSKSKSSPKSMQKLQVKSQVTKTATRVGLKSKSPDSSLHLCCILHSIRQINFNFVPRFIAIFLIYHYIFFCS